MSEDTVRTREDYNALDRLVERERSGITGEDAVNYDDLLENLDGLYNERVANTESTTMVERDQETFKVVNSAVYDNLNERSRNSVGRITTQMLVNGIYRKRRAIERVLMEEEAEQAREDGENQDNFEEQIRIRAHHQTFNDIGDLLYRGSLLLLGEPWTPFSPSMGGDPVERRAPTRGTIEREPTATNQDRPETGALNQGLEDTSDQRQLRLQNLIIDTVKAYEADQKEKGTNKPLLIYRLCYDFNLSRCIENFFIVSILVKECKLKIDAYEGLPVVSSVPEPEDGGPEGANANTETDTNNINRAETAPSSRQQMNISLDQHLHEQMRRLFKEPMILRDRIGITNGVVENNEDPESDNSEH